MSVPVYIIKSGAYCLIKDLNEKYEGIIKSTFTIRNKNIMGYFDVIKCYSYKKAGGEPCIIFPRFGPLFLKNKIPIIVNNNIPTGQSIIFNISAKFAGNQEIVFNKIFKKHFDRKSAESGAAGSIINLEAGQGKTFIGLHIIAKLQLKTAIIVHSELMLHQWIKVISEWMPNANIGQWYAKKKIDGDIVICIINSAFSYENWIDIGLCIFDEAHLYCSKKRSNIFKFCQSTYMLGLSATPDEKKEKQDNTYKIIQWEIGPILDAASLEGYTATAAPFRGTVKMIKYKGHPNYIETQINEKLELVSNPKMIQQLIEDPYRIKLVVKLAKNIIQNSVDTNLFIFADRRIYLENIHEHLNNSQYLTCADEEIKLNASIIMGGSKSNDVDYAERNSKIILTTYKYFGTGKSVPKMNAMILATPFKTGSKQYINRIFRLGSDYSIVRQIIDVVDWSTTLKSQWYWRKRYYNEKQYPITVQDVSWNEFAEPVLETEPELIPESRSILESGPILKPEPEQITS